MVKKTQNCWAAWNRDYLEGHVSFLENKFIRAVVYNKEHNRLEDICFSEDDVTDGSALILSDDPLLLFH